MSNNHGFTRKSLSLRPVRIEVTADSLVISGNYGYSVKLSEIQSVEMLDRLPRIKIRSNGIGWKNIKIGHFILEGTGKCRLYVNRKYPSLSSALRKAR